MVRKMTHRSHSYIYIYEIVHLIYPLTIPLVTKGTCFTVTILRILPLVNTASVVNCGWGRSEESDSGKMKYEGLGGYYILL